MSGFLRIAGLMWPIRSSIGAPKRGQILTESPRDRSLPSMFYIIESQWQRCSSLLSVDSLRMKIFQTNLQFFKSATSDSFFLSFQKALFPVILLSFVFLVTEFFEQKCFELELDYCYPQGWNRLVSAHSLCHLSLAYLQLPKAEVYHDHQY